MFFSLTLYGLAVLAQLAASAALADTGVSDERVSLPDGPGSVSGSGENLSASGNMGAMVYSVPLAVPQGYQEATPSLALTYNSMNGSGEVGTGWDLLVPHIERFTHYGVPRYDREDVFAADGSQELVRVASAGSARVYRERFEGSFVRYSWRADPDGVAGYWVVAYPDGRVGYFGADSEGRSDPDARVTLAGSGRVFRYLLAEMRDRFGHRVRYRYTRDWGDYPLLSEVDYVFRDGRPHYRVLLRYESRRDVLSNALSGAELRLQGRLSRVEVFAGGRRVQSYGLDYDVTPVGTSRLKTLTRYGSDGSQAPERLSFEYSPALDMECQTCPRPYVFSMGTLLPGAGGAVDFKRGLATLLDINADGLPDLLDTGWDGRHRFFLNTLTVDGAQRFDPPTPSAQTQDGSRFTLNAPTVQAVDINGDGRTDLIDTSSGDLLCNLANGDWSTAGGCGDSRPLGVRLPEDLADPGGSDPWGMRFLDYDGDKRVDLLHTLSQRDTQVWRNTVDGFVAEPVQALGKTFDDASTLQLADMNGDGLLDPVEVTSSGTLWYRLNLGMGRWSQPFEQQLRGGPEALEDAELQDLNGDGLDDVVVVRADTVQFALNQAGKLLPFQVLRSEHLGEGLLPAKTGDTTVLFADMNGSGSADVVWIDPSGEVRVLELFPLRPHLLTRIDGGLGEVQSIEYTTSARERARDRAAGMPWRHPLPQPMSLVRVTERFSALTPEVRDRTEYLYHHGFYDGAERRYRGFAQIEHYSAPDPTQQAALSILEYDVGDEDVYRHGRLTHEQHFTGEGERRHLVRETEHLLGDCPLREVPTQGVRKAVRFVCEHATETRIAEGRPEAEWVTLRREERYDGYGNVTLTADLGVVGTGPTGQGECGICSAPTGTHSGPCGAECRGDERFVVTQFISPETTEDGTWLLGQAWRITEYGDPAGPRGETLNYYDHPDGEAKSFSGLPAGQRTRGVLTRQCSRVTPEAAADCEGPGWVQSVRALHDRHGNRVLELAPLGSPDDLTGHRRSVEYDPLGLQVTGLELFLSRDDTPYRLRREIRYHPVFDEQPVAVTRWMLQGLPVSSARGETLFEYDALGRRTKIARPGDTLDRPTHEFRYELAKPVSQIITTTRTGGKGSGFLERRVCVDGLGRTLQRRTRLADGLYQVDSFRAYNGQGLPVWTSDSYQAGWQCDLEPPSHVSHREYYYDGAGRSLRVTEPDAELHAGLASTRRTEYRPLAILRFDPEDNDPGSPHYNTPSREVTDGLDRLVRVERVLVTDGPSAVVHGLWDDLGRVAGYVDASGHHKRQTHDLLGRVTGIESANEGATWFVYDANGNLTERIDPRGSRVRTEYDGADRPRLRFAPEDRASSEVRWQYDFSEDCDACSHGEGRLVSSSFPLDAGARGEDQFGFDLRGQRTEFLRILGGLRLQTRTAYDNAARVIERRYPDGTSQNFGYDGASRSNFVSGAVDRVVYDGRGRVFEVAYENGTYLRQDHDVQGRLRSARTLGIDGSPLMGFDYRRDRAGNIASLDDLSQTHEQPLRGSTTFGHDAWYRTTWAEYSDKPERLDFGFDLLDNIIQKTSSRGIESPAHTGAYEIDPKRPNAAAHAGRVKFQYDEAGRVRERASQWFEWDALGKLRRVVAADGGQAEYFHGSSGQRVMARHGGSVTYYAEPNFELRDGVAVTYARLGGRRVARSATAVMGTALFGDPNGDGRVEVGDVWLRQRRGEPLLSTAYGCVRRLLLEATPGTTILHADHRGSLALATNDQGQATGRQRFYLNGLPRQRGGYVDAYAFGGQRRDPISGLIHFRHRELDPIAGRWISPDPYFLAVWSQGLRALGEATTAYAYVANRTADTTDPTGLVTAHGLRLGLRGRHRQPTRTNDKLHQEARRVYEKGRYFFTHPLRRFDTNGPVHHVQVPMAGLGQQEPATGPGSYLHRTFVGFNPHEHPGLARRLVAYVPVATLIRARQVGRDGLSGFRRQLMAEGADLTGVDVGELFSDVASQDGEKGYDTSDFEIFTPVARDLEEYNRTHY